ncbi:MAG: PspC domain-containing protein [Ruminococcaceae bacterium]|nr:PspC domain-containing protein [Oscillospiraceae bacterium]
MEKKLYRSKTDQKIAGVCAGLAKYINIDVTIVRLIWAIVGVCAVGTGIIAYLICALIIPEEPAQIEG